MSEPRSSAPLTRTVGLAPDAAGSVRASVLHGSSQAIERVRSRIRELARGTAGMIVVQGEVGTGKRRAAMALHCASTSAPLAFSEAEAGGHALAIPQSAGTFVVHAIDRAGPAVVAALLAASGRTGGPRIVLSTRVPLGELRARSPEHSRLIGLAARASILIPPLRSRRADIAELARALATEAAQRYGRPLRGLSPGALARLEAHDLPGNVAQLRALIEVATLQARGDWITADSFSGLGPDATASLQPGELVVRLPGASLREIEVQVLRLALRMAGGRIVRTAELLGITRHALRRKLGKYDQELRDLRAPHEDDAEDDAAVVSHLHEDSDASFI